MKLLQVLCLAALTPLVGLAQPTPPKPAPAAKPFSELLYGVAYYYEYMPEERLAEDIRLMKEIGINTVRISESTWGYFEPEDGVFNTGYLTRVLDEMHAAGIKVIIGTPTYAVPPWLAKKHPEILIETRKGKQRYGARQIMDITHPVYLFHSERVIRKLMEVAAKHPSVIGYQLDNETKQYDNWNENVQVQFVKHLKAKFATPQEMSRAFGLHYWSNSVAAWEDMPSTIGAVNGSLTSEFEKFQRLLVTRFLAWQAKIVREYARPDQFLTQNFDADWRNGSFGINPFVDHFEASRSIDVCGIDIYHPTQDALTGMTIAMLGDLSRSNKDGANYLVLETSAQSTLNSAMQRLHFPGQLRQQAFSHLASGANMVAYWPWHSIHNSVETYWKGLLSHDMEHNATTREATRIAQEFKRLSPSLANLKKENEVAVYFSNEALTALTYFGFSYTVGYNDLLMMLYEELYRMNVECDFVDHTKTDLSRYKLIVVPALYAASKEETDRLNAFVANGGHVVYTFKSCFVDENVQVHRSRQPAPIRTQVGAWFQQFTNLEAPGIPLKSDALSLPADALRMQHWIELLMPEGAEVWARYDHPHWGQYAAITHHRSGKGAATYIGGYPTPQLARAVLKKAVEAAEVRQPDRGAEFPIIARHGTTQKGRPLHYVFNYSAAPVRYRYAHGNGRELFSGKSIARGAEVEIPAWDLIIVEE